MVDIEQGINAIFEPFLATGSKPDSYEQLQEVCKLLTLKQANALLLLESLKNGDITKRWEINFGRIRNYFFGFRARNQNLETENRFAIKWRLLKGKILNGAF